MNPGDELGRFLEIRDWLRRTVLCCSLCCLRYALVAVEKESGRTFDPGPDPCKERDEGAVESRCAIKVRAAWATRPKRAEQKAA